MTLTSCVTCVGQDEMEGVIFSSLEIVDRSAAFTTCKMCVQCKMHACTQQHMQSPSMDLATSCKVKVDRVQIILREMQSMLYMCTAIQYLQTDITSQLTSEKSCMACCKMVQRNYIETDDCGSHRQHSIIIVICDFSSAFVTQTVKM